GGVEREPAVLPQPELPHRIQAAVCMRGARVRLGRPWDSGRGANEVEGVGAGLGWPRASGRERDELVDAVAPGVVARHARAAAKHGATPAHFPERRELRFDVAHRVDPIAGRVVEVVRLAKGPSADVQGARVVENAVRKRLEEDAGAELERRGTETLDALADLAVPHRGDAGPRAALADRRREDELERRALAEARTSSAQVLVQLAEVQPGQHAVDRHVDIGVQEAGWIVGSPPVTTARLKPERWRKAARRRSVSVGWKKSDASPVLLHIGQSLLHCSPNRKRTALCGVTGSSSGTFFLKSRGAGAFEKSLPGAVIMNYDPRADDAGHAHHRGRPSRGDHGHHLGRWAQVRDPARP